MNNSLVHNKLKSLANLLIGKELYKDANEVFALSDLSISKNAAAEGDTVQDVWNMTEAARRNNEDSDAVIWDAGAMSNEFRIYWDADARTMYWKPNSSNFQYNNVLTTINDIDGFLMWGEQEDFTRDLRDMVRDWRANNPEVAKPAKPNDPAPTPVSKSKPNSGSKSNLDYDLSEGYSMLGGTKETSKPKGSDKKLSDKKPAKPKESSPQVYVGPNDADSVTKIQLALISQGFPLPKFGADGDFGSETKSALKAYKMRKAEQGQFFESIDEELTSTVVRMLLG